MKTAGYNEFTAMAAASAPNNSVFIDTADNLLKTKDNTGTVSELAGGGGGGGTLMFNDHFFIDTNDIGDWHYRNRINSGLWGHEAFSNSFSKVATGGQGTQVNGYLNYASMMATQTCTLERITLQSESAIIENVTHAKIWKFNRKTNALTVLAEETQMSTDYTWADMGDKITYTSADFGTVTLDEGEGVYAMFGCSTGGEYAISILIEVSL
jgi:hypothetical protein